MPSQDAIREKCPNLQANMKQCNCSYEPCERKGLCCQCLHYHRRNGQLPACFFPEAVEKTYDRSIARFIQCRR